MLDLTSPIGAPGGAYFQDPSAAGGMTYSGTATPLAPGGGINLSTLGSGISAVGAGAALGGILGMSDNPPPSMTQAGDVASTLEGVGGYDISQGQLLQSYLTSGTLPPALQAQLDLATNAAKAARVQSAATMGGPADATRNTALGQDLSSIGLQEAAQEGQLETQLYQAGTQILQSGVQALGSAGTILNQITSQDIQMQQSQTQAITGFASALASLFGPAVKSGLGGAAAGASSAGSLGGIAGALPAII